MQLLLANTLAGQFVLRELTREKFFDWARTKSIVRGCWSFGKCRDRRRESIAVTDTHSPQLTVESFGNRHKPKHTRIADFRAQGLKHGTFFIFCSTPEHNNYILIPAFQLKFTELWEHEMGKVC